jgi:hypothetical protein
VSEFWHAEKWRKDIDVRFLSPMYADGSRHYYVLELARLKTGQFVVPVRWLSHKSTVKADAYEVQILPDHTASIIDDHVILIDIADLQDTFLDLLDQNNVPNCDGKYIYSISTLIAWRPLTNVLIEKSANLYSNMPNVDRIRAGGEPLYTSFIDYFGDDVSGNRSKSWNKHWNAYMAHRNLPRQLLQQEFHVHFLSTSPTATISEQFQAFKQVVEFVSFSTLDNGKFNGFRFKHRQTRKEPIPVRDVMTGEGAKIQLFLNADRSDNPMQSEMSGHIGGKGNRPCRKCEVGGTSQEKETNEGYHSLFEVSYSRCQSDHCLIIYSNLLARKPTICYYNTTSSTRAS